MIADGTVEELIQLAQEERGRHKLAPDEPVCIQAVFSPDWTVEEADKLVNRLKEFYIELDVTIRKWGNGDG